MDVEHNEEEAGVIASADAQRIATVEAELDAIDAIARFKYTNMRIDEYGDIIDNISGLSQEFVADLRSLGQRINEPDLEPTAFDTHPAWSFTESSERYGQLRESLDFSQYIRSTQSQSLGSQSQPPSTPAPFSAPQSNQEHNKRQEKGKAKQLHVPSGSLRSTSPLRRSPRDGAPPRRFAGYVIEKDKDISTLGISRADNAAGTSSRVGSASRSFASGSSSTRQLQQSRLITNPKEYMLSLSSSSSDTDARLGPSSTSNHTKTKKRPATSSLSDVSKAKKKRRAVIEGSDDEDEDGSPDESPVEKRPAPPTALEREQQAAAEKGPSTAPAQGSGQGRNGVPTGAGNSASSNHNPAMTALLPKEDDEVDRDNSKVSRKAPDKPYAAFMEGDIVISAPARCSLLNAPTTAGYEGFRYLSSEWTDKTRRHVKEKWLCLVCGNPKTASRAGKNTNLITHRDRCPIPPAGIPGPEEDDDVVAIAAPSPKKTKRKRGQQSSVSTTLAGSYLGPSVPGWLNGQQAMHPDLTRRLALVAVVKNALPFQHFWSLPIRALVKSIDARATLAMVSGNTLRRDLAKFHRDLEDGLKMQLAGIDSLFALQHDAWTTKSFQYSFVAITASYVDCNWQFREVLLSFDVLKAKHTGATFSGHMLRTLKDFGIGHKWGGTITSDSAGTNHRMMDMLEYSTSIDDMQNRRIGDAADDKQSVALMKASPSAFPRASMRHGGKWTANENKILCMNHHINLAIRAGFTSLGVVIKTKTQQKVLMEVRPVPSIVVQDEDGRMVEVETERWLEEENIDAVLETSEANGAHPPKSGNNALEQDGQTVDTDALSIVDADDNADDAEAVREEADDEEEEEGDDAYESSGSVDDEEEEEENMGPSEDEMGSDDGGGPEVSPASTSTSQSGTRSTTVTVNAAIAKLEAFSKSIRKSSVRRDEFRSRMEKEYHRNPRLAQAPFPPKPNATRWNSHFAMIRGSFRVREAIDAHCRAHIGVSSRGRKEKFGEQLLNDAEWRMLELMMPILKLAAAATKDIEQAQGTLFKVLDHHASLRDNIEAQLKVVEEDPDLDDETAAALAGFLTAIENKLFKYREIALQNRLVLVAALLDPSNRLDLFKLAYPSHKAAAEKALRDVLKELVGEAGERTSTTTQGPSMATSAKPSVLQQAKMLRLQAGEQRRQSPSDEPDEVTRYLRSSDCPWRDSDETPYRWWQANEKVFPKLSKLARIVLAIPGSSSSVERVFSQAALFATNKRASLSSKALSELVSTKHWMMHGADELVGLREEARRVAESIAKLPEL
ncbi:hypothetical protein CF319_g7415 [Tilletia indica]|nr:hypothetical protein CF319_g7415 [Tilletia indica]